MHISTTDYGGAYKAAARINESMKACGVDSVLLLRTKYNSNNLGEVIFHNRFQKYFSKFKNVINILLSRKEVISDYCGTNITHHILIKEADVIVLHWVNSFIAYKNVEQLLNTSKKIIWVMHDMWLFTGGCHCDQYCGGYEHECGWCPFLKNNREMDISRRNFIRKSNMLNKGEITLVGPSNWITDCAAKSKITRGQKLLHIPNPINLMCFKPMTIRSETFIKYRINTKKKIVLFGAVNSLKDVNKGYDYLVNALKLLPKEQYIAVVFGNKSEDQYLKKIIDTIFLGYISDENQLAEIYNMADVFVAPSSQENYPNAVLEAEACGVPVVAFDIGGMSDMILHLENGYLAKYQDIEDLASGIVFCVNNKEKLGNNARMRSEKENDYKVVGNMYYEICKA